MNHSAETHGTHSTHAPQREANLWEEFAALPRLGEPTTEATGEAAHTPPHTLVRYILVNPAALPPLARTYTSIIQQSGIHGESASLLNLDLSCGQDGATPFLFAVGCDASTRGNATAWLEKLFAHARHQCALHIIDSSYSARDLAHHLTVCTDARTEDGLNVMLRYFDTRVIQPLAGIATPEQWAAFTACAHRWWYASRWDQFIPLPMPASMDAPDNTENSAAESAAMPWQLSAEQDQALIDAGEADAVIGLLHHRSHAIAQLGDFTPPQLYQHVRHYIAQAKSWGITQPPDHATYCHMGMILPPDFAQQQPWTQLLPQVKSGAITLTQALERVSAQHTQAPQGGD